MYFIDKLKDFTSKFTLILIGVIFVFGGVFSFVSVGVSAQGLSGAIDDINKTTVDKTATATATTSPKAATATSGQGALNFKECNFQEGKTGSGSSGLVDCLKSVLTFIFVIGVFVAAFRFVMVALGNYVPLGGGDPAKESKELISGLITGLILIGLPGLVLSLFNGAATNINVLFNTPSKPANTGTENNAVSNASSLGSGVLNNNGQTGTNGNVNANSGNLASTFTSDLVVKTLTGGSVPTKLSTTGSQTLSAVSKDGKYGVELSNINQSNLKKYDSWVQYDQNIDSMVIKDDGVISKGIFSDPNLKISLLNGTNIP